MLTSCCLPLWCRLCVCVYTAYVVRGKGVGTIMGQAFLRLARDLGYHASYFNLVRG